jgi:hypothetical protein
VLGARNGKIKLLMLARNGESQDLCRARDGERDQTLVLGAEQEKVKIFVETQKQEKSKILCRSV